MQVIKSIITGLDAKTRMCTITSLYEKEGSRFAQTFAIQVDHEDVQKFKVGQEVACEYSQGKGFSVEPVNLRCISQKADQYRRLVNIESMMFQVVSCYNLDDYNRYKSEVIKQDERKTFETYLKKDLNYLIKASCSIVLENIPTDEFGKTRLCQREKHHLIRKKNAIEASVDSVLKDYDYKNSVSYALICINNNFVEPIVDYFDKANDIIKNKELYMDNSLEESMEKQ